MSLCDLLLYRSYSSSQPEKITFQWYYTSVLLGAAGLWIALARCPVPEPGLSDTVRVNSIPSSKHRRAVINHRTHFVSSHLKVQIQDSSALTSSDTRFRSNRLETKMFITFWSVYRFNFTNQLNVYFLMNTRLFPLILLSRRFEIFRDQDQQVQHQLMEWSFRSPASRWLSDWTCFL